MEEKIDILHSIVKWLDHNRYIAVGLVIWGILAVGLASCQPRTISILNPPVKVTATELEREVVVIRADIESKTAQLDLAMEDIQRQIELRRKIIEAVGGVAKLATTGTIDPTTGMAAVIQMLTLLTAVGAVADNRRKDKTITALKVTS